MSNVNISLLQRAVCLLAIGYMACIQGAWGGNLSADTVSVTNHKPMAHLAPCGIRLTVTPSACYSLTNYYTLAAQVEVVNAPVSGTIAFRSAAFSTTYKYEFGVGTSTVPMSAFNLVSNGQTYSVEASVLNSTCTPVSETFVAPEACTLPSPLSLRHKVSRSRAEVGQVVTFTVCVANTGTTAATDLTVIDEFDEDLIPIPGSFSLSTGSFDSDAYGATWTIASLPIAATATFVFSASVLAEGVQYCRAILPGALALACVSVPFKACKNTDYAIELLAPIGYSNYQWRITKPGETTATVVYDGPLETFTATQPGLCEVYLDGRPGSCGGESCCPILIEETEVPVFTAVSRSPTCVRNQPQTDGQVTLMNFVLYPNAAYEYQYSRGDAFNASAAFPAAPAQITGDTNIGSGLTEGKYTIRITEKYTGCFRDVTVELAADCTCGDARCVPISVTRFTIDKRVE